MALRSATFILPPQLVHRKPFSVLKNHAFSEGRVFHRKVHQTGFFHAGFFIEIDEKTGDEVHQGKTNEQKHREVFYLSGVEPRHLVPLRRLETGKKESRSQEWDCLGH
jgi:hypothetical protein